MGQTRRDDTTTRVQQPVQTILTEAVISFPSAPQRHMFSPTLCSRCLSPFPPVYPPFAVRRLHLGLCSVASAPVGHLAPLSCDGL